MKNKKGQILFIVFGLLMAVSLWLPREAKAVNVWGDWFDRTVGQKGFNDVGFGRNDIRTIAANLVNILLGLLGVIAIVLIMYAGFMWMTAGGDPEKIVLARKILVSAAVGLLIVLSSWTLAIYILSRLWLATGAQGGAGEGIPCTPDGITTPCGCGGERVCSGGAWGACIGSNCGGPGDIRKSCDSNILTPVCEADPSACGDSGICDPTDCLCTPKGGYGDPCDSDTTSPTCQAETNLCQPLLTCDATQCRCLGEPVIDSVSPMGGFCDGSANTFCLSDVDCATFTPATCNLSTPNGAIGNLVSITGRYFLPYDSAVSKVFFWDGTGFTAEAPLAVMVNPSCTESWGDSQIVVAVPATAKSGAIKIVASNGADTTDNDRGPKVDNFVLNTIKRPGLCNLNPISGRLDSLLTYSGIGLGNTEAYFGSPYQSIKANNSSFASNDNGTAQVPNLRAGGTTTFVQALKAPFSNLLRFAQVSETAVTPVIVGFEPSTGPPGQYVTIRGSGFGRSHQDNQVYFGSTPADFDFPPVCAQNIWRDSEIIVKVPKNLADGDYKLAVEVGKFRTESDKSFKADKASPLYPGLCRIEPLFGQPNEAISLWGEHFGSKNASSLVRFNQDKDRKVGVKICQGGKDDGNNCSGPADCESKKCEEEIAYWGSDLLNQARVKPDLASTRVAINASTGPVRIGKDNPTVFSNGINFTIGQCASDNQCGGTNVCCAVGTPGAGRCKASASECYGTAEASVFEWQFDTGSGSCPIDKPNSCQDGSCCRSKCVLNTTTNTTTCLDNASCAGFGASQCLDSLLCPNSPGNCSNNDKAVITGTSCNCALLGCTNKCSYNDDLQRCVSASTCDLKTELEFKGKKLEKYCAINEGVARWHIQSGQTCPDGYNPVTQGSDICVDLKSTCSLCSDGLVCLDLKKGTGQCGMPQMTCPNNFSCSVDQVCTRAGGSCECCCDKTQNKPDGSNSACCAGLTCANECGVGKTASKDFGSCSGCADIGFTQDEHDAACNCTGTTGKFCDTSVQGGVCRDCSQIGGNAGACSQHNACCVDFKQGNDCVGVKDNKLTENGFSYCAYYDCADNCLQPSNPKKSGAFNEQQKCLADCPISCDGNSQDPGCQANLSKCPPSKPFCDKSCLCQKTPISCDGQPLSPGCQKDQTKCPSDQPFCNSSCFCEASDLGAGAVCSTPDGSCSLLCGASYSCRGELGCQGLGCTGQQDEPTCRCCCNPNSKGSNPKLSDFDTCKGIGSGNLACQENTGECTGNQRGLCCGAKTDADCGDIDNVGVGNDTCCHPRPQIEAIWPEQDSFQVCRNALIRAKFNRVMDKASLEGNVVLVGDYEDSICPAETVLLASAPINNNSGNWLANLWEAVKKIFSQVTLGSKEVKAATSHNFCAFTGRISSGTKVDFDESKTYVDFSISEALSPNIKYYVIVRGDDGSGIKTGVMDSNLVGFMGTNNTVTDTFNGLTYPKAYIWSFTTGDELCYLDNVEMDPSQHLFQKPADPYPFTANPLAKNGNLITPLPIYGWVWSWRSDNSQVASVQPNDNQATVTSGTKRDAETFVYARATIVSDVISPVSTVNTYKEGKAKIIVFLCANPWPAVNNPDAWPVRWQDQADNCTICTDPSTLKPGPCKSPGDKCLSYDFEFYYCRDKAGGGTKDDLPALASDQNPIRNNYKYKSSNRWVDVLKDFYFFRALMPVQPGALEAELTTAPRGGEVKLSWTATPDMVYKIYYGTASRQYSEVMDVVAKPDANNIISVIIGGLINNQDYYFAISATNDKKLESDYSAEKQIRIEDKVPPELPRNVLAKAVVGKDEKHIDVTWDKNTQDVLKYTLQYGPHPSFSVNIKIGSVSSYTIKDLNNLDVQDYYLKLSAEDAYGNLGAGVDVVCPAKTCPTGWEEACKRCSK